MSSVHLGYVYKISLEQLTVLPWRHAQGGKARRLGWCLVLCWERQQRKMAAGWIWPMALAWIKCWKCFWLLSYFSNPKHFSSYGREVQTGCLRRLIKRDHRQCLDSTGGIRLAVAAQGRRPSIRKSPCIKSKRTFRQDSLSLHHLLHDITNDLLWWTFPFLLVHYSLLTELRFLSTWICPQTQLPNICRPGWCEHTDDFWKTDLARSLIEDRSVSTVHKSFYNGPI